MHEPLVKTICDTFRSRPTAELPAIWTTNRRYEFSDEAFEAARRVLEERSVPVPAQEPPKTEEPVVHTPGIVKPAVEVLWIAAIMLLLSLAPLAMRPFQITLRSTIRDELSDAAGNGVYHVQRTRLIVIAMGRPSDLLVAAVGGIVAAGVCGAWYLLSRRRERRISYFLGIVIFLIPTLVELVNFVYYHAADRAARNMGFQFIDQDMFPMPVIAEVVVVIVGLALAYFVSFRRTSRQTHLRSSNGNS